MKPALHLFSRQPASWLALGWLALVGILGLLAPHLPLPYSATAPDLLHLAAPPDWQGSAHYLGTDPLGRDVLAGLLAGARRLLLLTLPAVALATVLGMLAGGAAGFWGNDGLRLPALLGSALLAFCWWALALPGAPVASLLAWLLLGSQVLAWAHAPFARWLPRRTFGLPLAGLVLGASTLLGAVPRLILLVAFAAGPPLTQPVLLGILTLLAWPEPARLVRAHMLRVRVLPFIDAARASGLPALRIWWHHARPAACQSLWAFIPLSLATLVGLESALAFLGIGQAPDAASWGGLLATVRQDPLAWWVAVYPGLALLVTLLALQRLGRDLGQKARFVA